MTEQLLTQLANKEIVFSDVLKHIEALYQHSPTAFKNGEQHNLETKNQGSAKVSTYKKINNLNEEQTLSLFAEHYQAVLDDPEGINHQNIRQFMINGWKGVSFDAVVLTHK